MRAHMYEDERDLSQAMDSDGDVSITWARAKVAALTQDLHAWGEAIDRRLSNERAIGALVDDINRGLTLEDLLDKIFETFDSAIPYDRIGCSIISHDGETVTARWARTKYENVRLDIGYSAPLRGSSLLDVLRTGKPRVISDLAAYLDAKPESESTRLVVAEGIRSSLTCPLIAGGRSIGFLYFSSGEPHAYDDQHIDLFQQIAGQVAILVEKARLVSELSEQREQLANQNAELNKLNALKNQFVGMVAHDIRNPLASIIMLADYLRSVTTDISTEHLELMEDIQDQSEHLLRLVEDLLDLTEIESGSVTVNREQLDLREFLQDAVRRHGLIAAAKDSTVSLSDTPFGFAHADPIRLRQVVDNLLSNAVKFSPPDSEIRVRATRAASGWRVEVEDQGPGISDDDRDRLFVPFARLSALPTGNEPSSGLGLVICKHLVEAHGGEIGVQPGRDGGSVFWFDIPDFE